MRTDRAGWRLPAILPALLLAASATLSLWEGGTVLSGALAVFALAAGIVPAGWRRDGPSRRQIAGFLLAGLAFQAIALGLVGAGRAVANHSRRNAAAGLRLREADLQERWNELLRGMERASAVPQSVLDRVAAGSSEEAFAEVALWAREHPLLGSPAAVALFDPAGIPLAWTGPLRDLDPPSNHSFGLERKGTTLLLVHRHLLEGAPNPLGSPVSRVEVLLGRGPDSPAEGLVKALGLSSPDRPGALLLSEDPGPTQAAEQATIEATGTGSQLVPLPDPAGDVLAVARLDPARPEAAARPVRIAGRGTSALALVCVALAALLLVREALSASRQAPVRAANAAGPIGLLLLSLLGIRIAASAVLTEAGASGSLAGPDLFAHLAPFGLLSSPLDFLLTGLAVLAGVVVLTTPIANWFDSSGRESGMKAGIAWARGLVALAGFAAVAGTTLLAVRLPFLCRINPIRFRLLEPEPSRLALQWGLLALTAAGVVILLTSLRGLGSWRPPAGRRPRFFVPLAGGLAALVAGAGLIAGSERAQRLLIGNTLASELVGLQERRERVLNGVLDRAAEGHWGSLAVPDEPGRTPSPALAFSAWSGTELAVTGLKSAVAILDGNGTLRSEFTCNLPPGIYRSLPSGPVGAPRLIGPDTYSLLTLRIGLLRGETALTDEGRVVGRMVVQLSSEPDNLPLFTRNDPLPAGLFPGGNDPVYEEFLGGDPVLVIYSATTGEVDYSSALRPPPLGPSLRGRLAGSGNRWRDEEVGKQTFRLYFFPALGGIVGLGAPRTGWSESASQLIRFVLLGLAATLLLAGSAALLAAPRRSFRMATIGWIETIQASWPRRLLATLLLATVIPLLALSAWVRAQVRERMQEGIETAGLTSLETARRLLEDYLEATAGTDRPDERAGAEDSALPQVGETGRGSPPLDATGAGQESTGSSGPAITDDALFWLSRVVRQDLSVFVGGRLVAASRPDLYETGVLSRCLDGAVARQLIHRRAPYAFREQPMGPERTLFIYAPVDLPGPGGAAVVGLPLTASQRQQQHEADLLGEGILAAAALLGGLLSLVAVAASRRISGPVRQLTRATAKVAEGDYSVRLPVATRDEPGQLMASFNTMTAALDKQRRDLRRRGDYIEKILLNATTGVISTGPGGAVRTINPAARMLLGLDSDPTGRRFEAILSSDPRLAPIARLMEEAQRGGDAKLERDVELDAGEARRRLRCVVLPLREREEGAAGRILLLEDLTEIVRSNRLAAWAEMARGIAHEIKNPLTPIQLSAEHLLRVRRTPDPAFDPVLEECVRTILTQVRELREISAEFSSYARLPALQRRPLEISELVHDAIGGYRASPPPGVTVVEEHRPAPPVAADQRVLRRCLVNLVENALQAMPDGGTLRVRTGPADLDTVEIEVADTGEGMDEETRARVFEPYFSTRESGTGLGLAIARRAVEEHGGTLTAHSRPGAGTTMTIRLPASR